MWASVGSLENFQPAFADVNCPTGGDVTGEDWEADWGGLVHPPRKRAKAVATLKMVLNVAETFGCIIADIPLKFDLVFYMKRSFGTVL